MRVRHVGLTAGPTRKHSETQGSEARLLRSTDGAACRRSGGPCSALARLFKPTTGHQNPTVHTSAATTTFHSPSARCPPPVVDMPPRFLVRSYQYLTPEHRLQLLEQIRARCDARIAAGLPLDVVDLGEELEEEEEDDGEDSEQQQQEEEEE